MGRRSPAAATRVNLIRVMDLLQTHITSALCQTVFRSVRRTERQRAWTLQALVQFWTAVILRAPEALSHALGETVDQREPLFPRIVASPEAVVSEYFDRALSAYSFRGEGSARSATTAEL